MKKKGKGKTPRKGLDKKDLEIMGALSRLGGKVSAEELGDITKYAPRTIRHRLKRLRDEGYLAQLYAQTHESKVGMGDSMLILQAAPNKDAILKEIIDSIPWFYYTGPTYGKYNGYLVHAMYSMDEPGEEKRIADELVSLEIIDQYFSFINTDYETRRADFRYFEYNKGWNWDWSQWIRESEGCITTGDAIQFKLEYEIEPIEFDEIDVTLIKELKVESNRTLKELGEIVGLSDTQVKRRISRLEENNVIKGFRWVVKMIELPLYIYLYMEIPQNIDCILSAFYRLPFPCEILMESREKYCIRLRLYGTEIMGLMRGLTHMRKYLDYYFIQIVHDLSDTPSENIGDYFNAKSMKFHYPIDETIDRIRKEYGGFSPI